MTSKHNPDACNACVTITADFAAFLIRWYAATDGTRRGSGK